MHCITVQCRTKHFTTFQWTAKLQQAQLPVQCSQDRHWVPGQRIADRTWKSGPAANLWVCRWFLNLEHYKTMWTAACRSARGPCKPQIRQFPLLAVSGCNQIKGLDRQQTQLLARRGCRGLASSYARSARSHREWSANWPKRCRTFEGGYDPPPPPRALMSRPALGCGAAKRANATSGHQRYRGPGKASGDDIMAVLLLTADYQLCGTPRKLTLRRPLGTAENLRNLWGPPWKSYWDNPAKAEWTIKQFTFDPLLVGSDPIEQELLLCWWLGLTDGGEGTQWRGEEEDHHYK